MFFSFVATASKSTTSASAKVAFVNLNFALAEMGNALAKCSKISTHGISVHTCDFHSL